MTPTVSLAGSCVDGPLSRENCQLPSHPLSSIRTEPHHVPALLPNSQYIYKVQQGHFRRLPQSMDHTAAHRRCGQAALGGGSTAGDFSNRNAWVRLPVSEAKFSTRTTGRFSYPTTSIRPADGASRRAFCFIFRLVCFMSPVFEGQHFAPCSPS